MTLCARRSGIALAFAGLFLASCAARQVPGEDGSPFSGRLPEGIRPTAYAIEWRIDPQQPRFQGSVTIELELDRPTEQIFFHAESLTLRRARFLHDGVDSRARLHPAPQSAGTGTSSDTWIARSEEILPAGNATLKMDFEGPFDRRLAGLYLAHQGEDAYVYTQFEPADARKAFPCLDEPVFKTPFAITVVTPRSLKVFSNAPLDRLEEEGDFQRSIFAPTPPLPTYLVALVVGPLDVVEAKIGDLPLRGLAARGRGAELAGAMQAHQEILPLFEDYFGIAYPYAKLDLAALVEFAAGAMENAGLITYREELLLSNPSTRSLGAEERIGSVGAHELAHQWFGNLVTMAWWNDLWLSEAFATWVSTKIVDRWRPEFEKGLDLLVARGKVFHTDSLAAARAVRQPVSTVAEAEGAFDGLTYVKGGSILEMLESWLGPEVFRAGIQRYLLAHAWQSATGAELFAALSAVSDEDVEGVARSFLDRPGVPLIETKLRCPEEGGVELSLSQTRYRALGGASLPPDSTPGGPEPWAIPLCLTWPEGERLARQCLTLDTPTRELPLATTTCPPWIHPNAGEHGYFRWKGPAEHLPAMARWLEGRSDTEARRMRVALLDQAWSAMEAGTLDPAVVLSLIEHAGHSADPRLRRAAAGRVARMAGLWPGLTETSAFRAFSQRVLAEQGRRLGWVPVAGEARAETHLRGTVLWVLGRHGDSPWVREGAAKTARLYLEHPERVSGDVVRTALRLARRDGAITQAVLLDSLSQDPSSQQRVDLLAGLGAAPAGPELEAALALVFDDRLRAQDAWYLIGGGFDGEARARQTFAFLRRNYEGLQKRLPSFGNRASGRLARLVGSFCNPAERDLARAFFQEMAAPDHERYLALGTETANRCIALRAAGRASVERYLQAAIKPAPGPAE